jgi:hypothetical protein
MAPLYVVTCSLFDSPRVGSPPGESRFTWLNANLPAFPGYKGQHRHAAWPPPPATIAQPGTPRAAGTPARAEAAGITEAKAEAAAAVVRSFLAGARARGLVTAAQLKGLVALADEQHAEAAAAEARPEPEPEAEPAAAAAAVRGQPPPVTSLSSPPSLSSSSSSAAAALSPSLGGRMAPSAVVASPCGRAAVALVGLLSDEPEMFRDGTFKVRQLLLGLREINKKLSLRSG